MYAYPYVPGKLLSNVIEEDGLKQVLQYFGDYFGKEKFEINESDMNRLWGKKNFQKIINSNGEFTNNELIKTFQELSKKYHFYD